MVSPTTPPKVKIMGLGNNREVNDGGASSVVGVNEEDSCSFFPSMAHQPTVSESVMVTPIFLNQSRSVIDKVESGIAGVCGLGNLGNTCFMSAGVQCLVATPPLASALLATLPQDGLAPLTRELALLTKLIWSGEYSALRPTKFKDSLGKHYPQFNDYRQHDCQEFLALLLDGLHEQMNSAVIAKDIKQGDSTSKFCDQGKSVNLEWENDENVGSKYLSKKCVKNDYWHTETNSQNLAASPLSLPGTSSLKSNDKGDHFPQPDLYDHRGFRKGSANSDSDSDEELSKDKLIELNDYLDNINDCATVSSEDDIQILVKNVVVTEQTVDLDSATSKSATVKESTSVSTLNNSTITLLPTEIDINPIYTTESEPSNEDDLLNIRNNTDNEIQTQSITNIEYFNVSSSQIEMPKIASLNNSSSLSPLNNCNTISVSLNLNSPNKISCQSSKCEDTQVCNYKNGQWLTTLEDILKESKTSNVNVLGKDSISQAPNNAIRFDSEKYPRFKDIRKKSDFEHNILGASGKRSGWLIPPGLDLKRVKLDDYDNKNRPQSPCSPHKYLEKNIRLEEEMKERGGEAENAWRSHLSKNASVIVSTFQGQLKSEVVCSVCQYVSITYEPFMYLSVPLPNSMKKQLRITYINKSSESSEMVFEVNKNECVLSIKEKLFKMLDLNMKECSIVLAEVLNNHIAKLLDELTSIGSINDSSRQIYAFEVVSIETDIQSDYNKQNSISDIKMEEEVNNELTCAICLENKDMNIKKHINCTFLICDSCVTPYCAHCSGSITCPVCRCTLNPIIDLIPVSSSSVPIRDVKVSLVYRIECKDDVKLIGHPSLIKVPNSCTAEWLKYSIASFMPYKQPFSLKIVDGQGLWCQKCLYAEHCRGCPIESKMRLNPNDTLAVCLESPLPELPLIPYLPLPAPPIKHTLSIYDCINAFSQSELLDENNPWFCPNCKKNQCATKSLSIWRYPDYLIVYLKRFVFHNHTSTKIEERVEFPLEGLTLSSDLTYDLYACVCHIGGISAGHYTTYTLHSETGEWHYFNDSYVTKQSPQEKDFSSAYILFYRKRIS